MQTEAILRTAIKNFAMEAGRFTILDLAGLLNQPPKRITKLIKDMLDEGELHGVFTIKNDEFITTERLKSEINRIIQNPQIPNRTA
jgi:hypothetical protein